MKKFYSLVAAVVFAATVNAQGAENLDTRPTTAGSSYTTVNFTGEDSTSWAFASTRIVDTSANFNIAGTSALISANGTATITFANGVGTLNFQYRKAFTGGTARTVQVSVDGVIVNTTPQFGTGSGAQSTVYDYSLLINKAGSVVVEIKVLGAQTTLDNFAWTAYDSTLAVVDANASKAKLVKNTVVDANIIFAAKADVKVINANGQVVKTASVNENSSLEVSSLPAGIYIVTGNVVGKGVSQKIIKK